MYAIQQEHLTERGFLCDPGDWTSEVADTLARAEGIEELTQIHWQVLRAIRGFFDENGIPPSYHILHRQLRETDDLFKFNCVFALEHLFPRGGIKQAARIAGLPDYFCFGC